MDTITLPPPPPSRAYPAPPSRDITPRAKDLHHSCEFCWQVFRLNLMKAGEARPWNASPERREVEIEFGVSDTLLKDWADRGCSLSAVLYENLPDKRPFESFELTLLGTPQWHDGFELCTKIELDPDTGARLKRNTLFFCPRLRCVNPAPFSFVSNHTDQHEAKNELGLTIDFDSAENFRNHMLPCHRAASFIPREHEACKALAPSMPYDTQGLPQARQFLSTKSPSNVWYDAGGRYSSRRGASQSRYVRGAIIPMGAARSR